MDEIIDFMIDIFHKLLSEGKSVNQAIELILPGYHHHFLKVAAIIKHPAFEEEREWRIVTGLISYNQLHCRLGKSMLIPYLPIQFKDSMHQFPVDEIIVGPTSHQYLAANAVNSLLSSTGIKAHSVRISQIPYREL